MCVHFEFALLLSTWWTQIGLKSAYRGHEKFLNTRQHQFAGCNDLALTRRQAIIPWWRHELKTFSALLALCAGNSPVTGEFPSQRPVMNNFNVFFHLCLNKRLSKKSWGWWLETPSRPLWCRCNANKNDKGTRYHMASPGHNELTHIQLAFQPTWVDWYPTVTYHGFVSTLHTYDIVSEIVCQFIIFLFMISVCSPGCPFSWILPLVWALYR